MGEVWRAVDTTLDRPVALKRLRPDRDHGDGLARLEREARLQASLASDHIARLHGLERAAGEDPFLVMELVEGRRLDTLIAEGPLPIDLALSLFAQLCLGLRVAHAAGVVHRDLKPANLLIRPNGTLVIVDFGVAARRSSEPHDELTRTGAVIGSTAYLSPQQASGERVGPEADLWAAGVTLYEMLTGERPFSGTSAAETVAAILRDPPIALRTLRPEVPRRVARLAERCLSKDPGGRPLNAGEMLDALPDIPIPIAGRPGRLLELDLLARSAAHPPLPRLAHRLLPVAVLAATALALGTADAGWAQRGAWTDLDVVRARAGELLERIGLPVEDGHHAVVGYMADAEGHAAVWARVRPGPFHVSRVNPSLDRPASSTGEARLTWSMSGRLTSFEWWPDERALNDDADEVLRRAMGASPPPDGARTGTRLRGRAVSRWAIADDTVERAGDHGDVVWMARLGRVRTHEWLGFGSRRGRPAGLVAGVVLVILLIVRLRRREGDLRGAALVGGLFAALEWLRVLFLPDMWIEGGWRDIGATGAATGVLSALMYYALEPTIRRQWPGLLVGWSRLTRSGGRDAIVGREVLLGSAALLVPVVALLIERALLGSTAAPVRELAVPYTGHLAAWLTGYSSALLGASFIVLSALLVGAIVQLVTRVGWLARAVGMLLAAAWLTAPAATFGWGLAAAHWVVLMILAYRGGLLSLVVYAIGALLLAALLPWSAGVGVAGYGVASCLVVLATAGFGVWASTRPARNGRRETSEPSRPKASRPEPSRPEPSRPEPSRPERSRSEPTSSERVASDRAPTRREGAALRSGDETETLTGGD